METLEIFIFRFVTVFGSFLLLVLLFNCLQSIYENLRSRSIVKEITGKFRGRLANWQRGNQSTRSALTRLKSLPFLHFKGRATSEQELLGRASFQFEIIGTPWIAVVFDIKFAQQTGIYFIYISNQSAAGWRPVRYESFLQHIGPELRRQFEQHRELFRLETRIRKASPVRLKLKHWIGRCLGWFFGAYAVSAGLYLVYGLIYNKGIVGYLMYYFGEDVGGGDTVTDGGGVAIALYLFSLIGYFFLDLNFDDNQNSSPAAPTGQEQHANESWRPISWKTILGVNSMILILTALILVPLILVELNNQRQVVFQADLDRGQAPPEFAKFAALRGVLRSDREFHWVKENGSTNETWTPLVGSDWRAEEPVKFFHYRRWESAGTSGNSVPAWPGPQNPITRRMWLKRQELSDEFSAPRKTYPVQLSRNALPTWVEMKLRDQKIKLASPYYLAEKVELDANGKVISNPYGILIIGAFVSGSVMLIANVIMLRRYFRTRKLRVRRAPT